MKRIIFLSLVLSTIAFASCSKLRLKGEGSILSETRQLETFTGIEANGSTDVEVVPSSSNSVVITGYQNLIPVYETKVKGGKLVLEYKRGYINVRNNNIKVIVYTTSMNSAYLNGSGNITFRDSLTSRSMSVEINGSGDMSFGANAFQTAKYKINGSGNINARAAVAENVTAEISGSGDMDITVTQSLKAEISGSGTIDYWGNPAILEKDISGSGKVRKN
jgi:hypothetical protein